MYCATLNHALQQHVLSIYIFPAYRAEKFLYLLIAYMKNMLYQKNLHLNIFVMLIPIFLVSAFFTNIARPT